MRALVLASMVFFFCCLPCKAQEVGVIGTSAFGITAAGIGMEWTPVGFPGRPLIGAEYIRLLGQPGSNDPSNTISFYVLQNTEQFIRPMFGTDFGYDENVLHMEGTPPWAVFSFVGLSLTLSNRVGWITFRPKVVYNATLSSVTLFDSLVREPAPLEAGLYVGEHLDVSVRVSFIPLRVGYRF